MEATVSEVTSHPLYHFLFGKIKLTSVATLKGSTQKRDLQELGIFEATLETTHHSDIHAPLPLTSSQYSSLSGFFFVL